MAGRKPGRKKGTPRTGGRRKGTPNKVTASTKAALVEAFELLGGVPALVRWGKRSPSEFYRLWGRLLPVEVRNPDGEAFTYRLVVEDEEYRGDGPADGEAAPEADRVPAV